VSRPSVTGASEQHSTQCPHTPHRLPPLHHARPQRPRIRHPRAARRRRARPGDRRPRHPHPPEHQLRVPEQRARRLAVQHGALGPCLQPHQQPHHRGAGGAGGGAGGRCRRHRHRQRPGRAAPGGEHAGRRRPPHRGQRGAVRRQPQPAGLHAAPLRHRDHLRAARRPGRLARRDPPQHPAAVRRDPGQSGAGRAGHPGRLGHRPRPRPAAAGRFHLHPALAVQAAGAWRRPGVPLGDQVPVRPRHGGGRRAGRRRRLRLGGQRPFSPS